MSRSQTVLITGASGFVGREVTARFAAAGFSVRAVGNQRPVTAAAGITPERVDLRDKAAHDRLVRGVDVVLHLAARAHVAEGTAPDAAAAYRVLNVDVTQSLAEAAVRQGVHRFVFLSTIGVHGEGSTVAGAVTEEHAIDPVTPYAKSKWQAEQLLRAMASNGSIETTIIRPTLVYGVGAPGNLALLRRAVERNAPLPFGRIANRRSLLSVHALAELLLLAATHPNAAGEIFVAADECSLSTPQIVSALARGAGRRAVMLPVPVAWLRVLSAVTGRRRAFQSLCGSLYVDAGKARRLLGWRSAGDPAAGLESAGARSFRE